MCGRKQSKAKAVSECPERCGCPQERDADPTEAGAACPRRGRGVIAGAPHSAQRWPVFAAWHVAARGISVLHCLAFPCPASLFPSCAVAAPVLAWCLCCLCIRARLLHLLSMRLLSCSVASLQLCTFAGTLGLDQWGRCEHRGRATRAQYIAR